MLDAVETERGNSSPSKTQGRRQISSSLYSVREKLLREHIEGANNAEGCGKNLDVSFHDMDTHSFLKLFFGSTT